MSTLKQMFGYLKMRDKHIISDSRPKFMKVLHVIPSLSPQRGGPSFAVRSMAKYVSHEEFEVHIVATDDDGANHLKVPLNQPIIESEVVYRYFRRHTKFYTFSWSLTKWLWQHINEYDLIHIHSLFSYSTVPAAWFAYWNGVPYIIRPLGHLNRWGIRNRRALLKRFSLHFIELPIIKRSALLHFTSEQERLEAEEVGVTSPYVIAPLGIDTLPFRSLPLKDTFLADYPQLAGKIIILFLSRIDRKKGIELLLSAFASVLEHNNHLGLVIAGSGDDEYLSQLRKMAEQLGIANSIIWTGFLQGNAKLSALAAADMFVLSSYSENFGIAVVEAMAAGLPVVISDQVGIHYEVENHEAGLVTVCDVDALADALQCLTTDPAERRRLGENGKNLVDTLFSQTAMARRLVTMYEDVLHRPGRQRDEVQPATFESQR